ncbi:hypothetical protein BDN70DRAFT_777139, partial [Pholiota conissans]
IKHLKTMQDFINLIQNATFNNGKIDQDVMDHLCFPEEGIVEITDPNMLFLLNLYLSCANASEATYTGVREAIQHCFPRVDILSYYSVKKKVANITGVVSIYDDMCIQSCHAFTGPFANLDKCALCGE